MTVNDKITVLVYLSLKISVHVHDGSIILGKNWKEVKQIYKHFISGKVLSESSFVLHGYKNRLEILTEAVNRRGKIEGWHFLVIGSTQLGHNAKQWSENRN